MSTQASLGFERGLVQSSLEVRAHHLERLPNHHIRATDAVTMTLGSPIELD